MTMTRTPPVSLSVYRGQSRRGIGEGPGSSTAHGEQYLGATPPLDQDSGLLEAIRPWMTLDSDPADHQRLNDRLEAWSLFCHRDRQFVVRLVSAGAYDSRAGYFSHGRSWPLDAGPGIDPGLCLGRSEAFENPWRDDDPGRRVDEPVPPFFRPERIAAEPERAAQLLAHLLQCGAHRRPLIIAAPVAEFAAGTPLPGLLSFARGALPADLRKECRVRIYTHTPELFLRTLGANLVVVPEELAGQALKVRREATLVDRQGKLLAGEPLEPVALSYAEAVIERALRIPDGLTAFGERFRDRRSRAGMPEEGDVRAIQVTYNLAVALAGSAAERGDLLRSYLPRIAQKLGPEVNWKRLIVPEEWRAFPRESILDLLLLDSAALSPGARSLQKAVESSAAQLELTVDSRLSDWWDPGEPAKLRRLLELTAHQPPLVSSSALAERTPALAIRRIAEIGATEVILDAELRQGSLRWRAAAESAELGELASSPGVLRILLRAVESGALGPAWARVFLEKASDARIVAAAPELLQAPSLFQEDGPWKEIPVRLLDRLRSLPAVPKELAPLIVQAGWALDPASNLPVYLRLAELLARINEEDGRQGENILISRLWREMPATLEPQDRELLVEAALGREWRCLQPRSLAQQGKLRPVWLEMMAPRLVPHEDLLRDLNVSSLLRLASRLASREDLMRIFEFVDLHMDRDLRSTTDALTLSGWWTGWRSMSLLVRDNPDRRQRTAETWLTSPAWTTEKMEATLEDWKQVLADLPDKLDMGALWNHELKPRRLWPWIPPFEGDQLAALAWKASDLIALAELTEAVLSEPSRPDLGEPPHRYVLRGSRFDRDLHADALGWLLPPEMRGKIAVLDLASSLRLWRSAGPRADRVLKAGLGSILDCLKKNDNAREAILAADELGLWRSPDLLAGLAEWMAERGSILQIGKDLLVHIESRVEGEPARRPKSVPGSLVRELTKAGSKKAARLLSPEMSRAMEKETLAQSVLAAFASGAWNHECWRELADEIERSTGSEHPLSAIAEEIRRLPAEEQRELGRRGWDTFETAARSHPALLEFRSGGPPVLPVFDLAASLSQPGGLGGAALQAALSAGGTNDRIHAEWWDALLKGIAVWQRYPAPLACPDDRRDLAMALVMQNLDDLGDDEQRVFWQALERRADNLLDWDLPLELGKR